MSLGKLRTAKLKNSPSRPYAISVYDEAGELVCWCGPYDIIDWRKCLDLFKKAGWEEAKTNYYHISKLLAA